MGRTLLQTRSSEEGQDSEAVHVHVCVLAEGPTRILRFSDTADQYTRNTSEETIGMLHKKVERLTRAIEDVDRWVVLLSAAIEISICPQRNWHGQSHSVAYWQSGSRSACFPKYVMENVPLYVFLN